MADGGEGEDEIQFLRTVSAARLGFPGEQGEQGHPPTGSGQWDTRAGRRLPPGMREEPGIPRGAQVCVPGRGKGGCVSVRACVKPGDRARPERGERAGGARAGSRGALELRESGDAGAAGRACPVGGAGIFRAAGGRVQTRWRGADPVARGARGPAGTRAVARNSAAARFLGLSGWTRAPSRNPGICLLAVAGAGEAGQNVPPSRGAAQGRESRLRGQRGAWGWGHWWCCDCSQNVEGMGSECVCACTRARGWRATTRTCRSVNVGLLNAECSKVCVRVCVCVCKGRVAARNFHTGWQQGKVGPTHTIFSP